MESFVNKCNSYLKTKKIDECFSSDESVHLPISSKKVRREAAIANGDRVIGSKEYNQVFVITCFLPFIRPTTPLIKQSDLKLAKANQKLVIASLHPELPDVKQAVGFFRECKATMSNLYLNRSEVNFNGKSMYLKVVQESRNKTVKK